MLLSPCRVNRILIQASIRSQTEAGQRNDRKNGTSGRGRTDGSRMRRAKKRRKRRNRRSLKSRKTLTLSASKNRTACLRQTCPEPPSMGLQSPAPAGSRTRTRTNKRPKGDRRSSAMQQGVGTSSPPSSRTQGTTGRSWRTGYPRPRQTSGVAGQSTVSKQSCFQYPVRICHAAKTASGFLASLFTNPPFCWVFRALVSPNMGAVQYHLDWPAFFWSLTTEKDSVLGGIPSLCNDDYA